MSHESGPGLDAIDRAVRRAVLAATAWQETLARQPFESSFAELMPLGRHRAVAGQTAFDALASRTVLSHETQWLGSLRRWVAVLTVLRVTEPDRVEQARAETDDSAMVRLERGERTSFRSAWRGLLRSQSVAQANAWLAALAERGEAVAAVRRERAVREEEVARRLGFSSLADLLGAPPPGELEAAARTFLSETRELARSLRREAERRGDAAASTFVGTILEGRATGAPEGWPSRLTLRALVETLHAPDDIGRGLRLRPAMPEAVGAASFARGLEGFGEAYRRGAAAASSVPFAVAVAPSFVDAHRYGFAFGALPSTLAYQRRGLGLVARVAAQQARCVAVAALLRARGLAATALFARHAARPDRASFEELASDVYGHGVPPELMGAFPRQDLEAFARLEASLTTLPFLERLRDAFEEDWFRNPHAWRFLRARAEGPARSPDDEPKMDPIALARAFEKALG